MKKKYLFILIFIILMIIFIFFMIEYHKKQTRIIYKELIEIKIGDKIPTIKQYVDQKDHKKLKNQKITWKGIKSEKNRIYHAGVYQGTFHFNHKKITIQLKVIDDEAPVIKGIQNITTNEKEKVDLLKNIQISDNSHDKVNIHIDGNYDINKKGEYHLKYVATDKSGNQTEKEFQLHVKEKIVPKKTSNHSTTPLGTSSKGYQISQINGVYYVNGILIANKTYQLPSTYNPNGLLVDFMNPFNQMVNDALKENINLKIVSGYRSYSTQDRIYSNYVKKDGQIKADTYSARPGHSEHQTGLAADINSLDQSFINTREGIWLNSHCYQYGFIIRYPKGKESITGYIYEPWHIRYVGKELATKLYNNGNWITLEEYLGINSKY